MKCSKIVGIGLSMLCAGAMALPAALPSQAEARTITASGTYSISTPTYSPQGNDHVKKLKLTKKKLTIKGNVVKTASYKRLKGHSFTFRVSPKVWIGEYADGKWHKYTGKTKKKIVKSFNKCSFPSISFTVRNGKVVKLWDHS